MLIVMYARPFATTPPLLRLHFVAAVIGRLIRQATLIVAVSALVPAFATETTIAFWDFSEPAGPVINSVVNAEVNVSEATSARHGGWVGYSVDTSDDGEVERDGSRAAFNGERDSIVLIDGTDHTEFNPDDGSLVITLQFAVDRSALSEAALAPKGTWNLIQKGRYNNQGGQWKMQIRKAPAGRLFFQCLINDDNPDIKRAVAQTVLKKRWIEKGYVFTGRCTLNRQSNELSLELSNSTTGNTQSPVKTSLHPDFGNVAPRAGECGSPNSFGANVAIGNKPLCPNQTLDTNDAFRGEVFSAHIKRF
ncbi:MAG: hypothetical protein KTR32_01210 [Granulosicoccus sp.]|nr:hypothetical protein [Granulosicoccus sp.]